MKDNRPVNLDIGSMRLPLTAWASITHRASGVFLVAASALLLWALDVSLGSPEGFARLQGVLSGPAAKAIVWLIATGLLYHALAGVKHLVMDFGIGESMEGGTLGARLVIGLAALASALVGVWLW